MPGSRAAQLTLRQLLREYGRRLPCLHIRDWPDFSRRGVMLDISRGRVPKLETLLDLAEKLADFKINELQLYTEHTFAYRKYKSVWQSWGALTAKEIQILDARCRELGIDLVPNQNSFGHLRYFLEDPRLKKLGELAEPYEAETRDFLRRPTTLAPNHPGTLPFLRGLYDELLPNFSSEFFNVGCDETWDLGKGRSKKLCAAKGKGRVYLDFLKKIHREVSRRGRTMMFWGDIILKYPQLIRELASFGTPASGTERTSKKSKLAGKDASAPRIVALNWGYEADHPFAKEAAQFAKAKIPFYVCPGTSTWQTLIGKHDNALANLRAAAQGWKAVWRAWLSHHRLGRRRASAAAGRELADAGCGRGAGVECEVAGRTHAAAVLSRDVFEDAGGKVGQAAIKLGLAHQKLGVNATQRNAAGHSHRRAKTGRSRTILPQWTEMVCQNSGAKHQGRIAGN